MYLLEYLATLSLEESIFFVLLPFIMIFAIFWGILISTRIFNRRISLGLALIITLITASTETFVWFSTVVMQLGALTGVIAFVAVFFVGVISWAFGRGKEFYDEAAGYGRSVEKIDKEMEKLWRKYDETRDPSIMRTIESLERKRRGIEREMLRR